MRKRNIVILLIVSMFITFDVKALSGSVSISCGSTSLASNSSTNCTIYGYSSEGVSGLHGYLQSSGSVTISNIYSSSIWQGNGQGGSFDLYTDENKSGSFQIGGFTVTVTGTGSVSFGQVNFSDAGFIEHSIGSTSVSFSVQQQQNTNKNTNTTNTNVTTNTVTTTQQTTTDSATKSSDATLKSLTLSAGNISFSKDTLEYNVQVGSNVDKISINAEATDSKAIVTLPTNLTLKTGKNTLKVIVTAEDATTKTYIINIEKLTKVLSTDSSLKSISIKGHNFIFDKDTFSYDLGNTTNSVLDVKAVASDNNAKVEIFGNNNIGANDTVVIKVTAEDGSVSEYILYINNTKTNNIDWKFIILIILFVASLGLNIFLIIKKKKMGKSNEQGNNKI